MMPVKKKAATKKRVVKKKAAPKKKLHPMKLNIKSWDKDKVLDFICDELATSSKGIGSILNAMKSKTGDAPSYSRLMYWLDADEALQEKYTRGKMAQADFMADELLEIADSTADEIVDQNGVSRKDGADVQHKRLRVDTRKWLASKLKPKKYGEKLDLTGEVNTVIIKDLTGSDGND